MSLQHLALQSDWDAARESGTYTVSTRGRTIAEVGFMHCSMPEQTGGVLERYYSDITEPLLLLTLDEAALADHGLEVRFEPPAPGVSELFPHVYGGDLPIGCVARVEPCD